MFNISKDDKIAVVGLGYVGLPLAVEFGRISPTIGYDVSNDRIVDLNKGVDRTLEVSEDELAEAKQLSFCSDIAELSGIKVFVVTVPTPITSSKQPNLTPLIESSKAIGGIISSGAVVIYESTVYPGATEEVCVPILEQESGLKFNKDFFVGYSPERINPGDKLHRVNNIVKVTSGSTPEVAAAVNNFYGRIVTAGTHLATTIKVAEAAKVIENTQRDLNIALINELAIIFGKLGIDTQEVLEAAGTKWNFLPFKPGLVGGHCISVDPYYLTHKAQEIGYHPRVILSGRHINDSMGEFVASQVIKLLTRKKVHVVGAKILVLGLAFKENCPDVRNTRVVDIVAELEYYNAEVDVFDPWVNAVEAEKEYDVKMVSDPEHGYYDAIILAVAHREFLVSNSIRCFGKTDHILYDIKSILPKEEVDGRL